MLTAADHIQMLRRLERPQGKISLILDTDTYNEIDDQYCLAYALLSPERIELQAVYAELFCNRKVSSYEEGMEKSYQEILNVLKLLHREDFSENAFRGSRTPLPDSSTPVDSDAARDLIRRARAAEGPLWVAAIGALTNIASALLMAPDIRDKFTLVWLGNNAKGWPHNDEFNYNQDPTAVQVVFDSGVPIVNVPAFGVTSHMTTSEPELRHWLQGKNELCDYLYRITCEECELYGMGKYWAKEIWDIVTVGWLLGDDTWTHDNFIHTPIVGPNRALAYSDSRPLMRQVYQIQRNKIFGDLFQKLQGVK